MFRSLVLMGVPVKSANGELLPVRSPVLPRSPADRFEPLVGGGEGLGGHVWVDDDLLAVG